jgi:hypothetical protein
MKDNIGYGANDGGGKSHPQCGNKCDRGHCNVKTDTCGLKCCACLECEWSECRPAQVIRLKAKS